MTTGGRRPRAWVEIPGLLLWLFVFSRIHATLGKDVAVATANALSLQSLERTLHLDIELGLNTWLAAHVPLAHAAVYVYRLYYAVIIGVLIWVLARHTDVYPQVRRTAVAMTALVLPVYWAVPMSPPRFAQPGTVDIVALYDILGFTSRSAGDGQNNYSAMPSMHVGWSLWCAYAAWSALRGKHPRLALLPWLFPMLMTAVVFTTGNHYVLDVVGSVLLFSAAVLVATLLGRHRPTWMKGAHNVGRGSLRRSSNTAARNAEAGSPDALPSNSA